MDDWKNYSLKCRLFRDDKRDKDGIENVLYFDSYENDEFKGTVMVRIESSMDILLTWLHEKRHIVRRSNWFNVSQYN